VTVAQIVHPAHNFARHSRQAFFRTLHQAAVQRLRRNDAALWRAIGIGVGFAAAGFAVMASALAG
jgi:hypothetical protein